MEITLQKMNFCEHIRLRPGIHIGQIGDGSTPKDGIYTLLKELLNNSVREFLEGHGNLIELVIDEKNASIRDYGSGCPLEWARVDQRWNHSEWELRDQGLGGRGLAITNALSACFIIESYHNGVKYWDRYSKGVWEEHGEEGTTEPDGTVVRFSPDGDVFERYSFQEGHIKEIVKLYCYMYKGLTINLNGAVFKSDGGLLDLMTEQLPLYTPIHLEGKDIEIVLTHLACDETIILSYVNGHPTILGGTHKAAFIRALRFVFKKLSKKRLAGRNCLRGVYAAIRINFKHPIMKRPYMKN